MTIMEVALLGFFLPVFSGVHPPPKGIPIRIVSIFATIPIVIR